MEIADRINSIMNHFGLNKTELSSRLGVSQAVFSHISSGRNKPSLELIIQLLNAFPELSSDWLILGKEPMLRKGNTSELEVRLSKLIEEVILLNDMNFNSLNTRLNHIKERLNEPGSE